MTSLSIKFNFIIGDEKIACHKFFAAFLYHAISQNLLSDPTLDLFYINIANQKNNEKIQAYLHQLINREHIEITEKEIQDFISQLNETSKDSDISDFPPTNITALLLLNQELQNDEIREEIYQLLFSALISNDKKNDKQEQNHTKEEITHKIIQIQKIETILNLIKNKKKDEATKALFQNI
ncbi:hypothetical protein M9Y10_011010 [Tritrichomonas musculus]|uniref:Uncharacterized protein n=1 Tax=Tritrichomonas musculus TaxID=1915356 RepID=A0ABR2IMA3_9EUKA